MRVVAIDAAAADALEAGDASYVSAYEAGVARVHGTAALLLHDLGGMDTEEVASKWSLLGFIITWEGHQRATELGS